MQMTVAEFIKANNDILTDVLNENNFNNLTDGCVVFMVTSTPGQKNIKDRVVRNAGYYMVVSTNRNRMGKMQDITVVGLTAGGYAKIEIINLGDLEYRNNKLVFLCNPLPLNDRRRNYHFL